MCLFEPCDEPEVLYSHSKDWLRHMRKHTRHWKCAAKCHGTRVFQSREKLDEHFTKDHNKKYSNAQLDLLAERALQSPGKPFEICPLCGGADDDLNASGNLTDHIIGHLRSLALKSLPPHYNDGDDTSSNSDAGKPNGSRSTLRDFLNEQEGSLASSTSSDQRTRHQEYQYKDGQKTPESPEALLSPNWAEWSESIAENGTSIFGGVDLASHNVGPNFFEPPSLDVDAPEATADFTTQDGPLSPSIFESDPSAFELEDPNSKPHSHAREYSITAVLDGFRQNVLDLNPMLAEQNGYLIDRIVHHQVTRYNELVGERLRHEGVGRSTVQECSSGKMCRSTDGFVKLLSPDKTVPISPATFPTGVPMPPASYLPAEFECGFCFKAKKMWKPTDWTHHIYEDLRAYNCTWDGCRDADKMFRRRSDWVRHENAFHRHLEWWTCDGPDDCRHTCYRRENFLAHLVREHKYPEPGNAMLGQHPTWQKVRQSHQKTTAQPQDEPCRFCGQRLSTWMQLQIHLAGHLERISLYVSELISTKDWEASTFIEAADESGEGIRGSMGHMPPPIILPPLSLPPRSKESDHDKGSLPQDGSLESPSQPIASTTNELFASRLQAANNRNLTARSAATAEAPAWARTPFKIGSPLAPKDPSSSLLQQQQPAHIQPNTARQTRDEKAQEKSDWISSPWTQNQTRESTEASAGVPLSRLDEFRRDSDLGSSHATSSKYPLHQLHGPSSSATSREAHGATYGIPSLDVNDGQSLYNETLPSHSTLGQIPEKPPRFLMHDAYQLRSEVPYDAQQLKMFNENTSLPNDEVSSRVPETLNQLFFPVVRDLDLERVDKDDKTIRCICGTEQKESNDAIVDSLFRDLHDSEISSEFFVQCDTCKVWQHRWCIGLVGEDTAPDEYYCEKCRSDLHKIYIAPDGYVTCLLMSLPLPSSSFLILHLNFADGTRRFLNYQTLDSGHGLIDVPSTR